MLKSISIFLIVNVVRVTFSFKTEFGDIYPLSKSVEIVAIWSYLVLGLCTKNLANWEDSFLSSTSTVL